MTAAEDDPLIMLVEDAVGLMHAAFAPTSDTRAACRECYHQLRKLWDRGIPVGMGLGHLLFRSLDAHIGFAIIRMGEHGQPDTPQAAILFGANDGGPVPGFPRTLCVRPGANGWQLTPAR